jgi:hypothetical protein
MIDPIPTLIEDLRSTRRIVQNSQDVSAQISQDDVARKVLLLSCASFLEAVMTSVVLEMCHELSGKSRILTSLVKTKVVDRQYHTWFDWKTPSAGPFFGMFGEEVKSATKAVIKKGSPEAEIMESFLKLGASRNRLVHGNVASFVLEDTFEEITQLYYKASWFPGIVRTIVLNS